MAEDTQVTALLVAHRKILRNTLIRITVYYAALMVLLGIFVSAYPSIVNELPLGGVGDTLSPGLPLCLVEAPELGAVQEPS